jgi:probable rRNA maturation factor
MVHVDKRLASVPFGNELVADAAEQTLRLEGASGDLTVVLTDDAQLRQLNRQYLDVDAPTDVLSFPSGEADPETGETYLGDVILSIPRAQVQATAAGHNLEAEVQLLVVHGVLHLLGYDHAEARGKAEMWAAQERALNRLGLSSIVIRE